MEQHTLQVKVCMICTLKQQFQCTVHKKKGLLGLSSLLFERSAPENRVLTIWQFRSSIFKRWNNLFAGESIYYLRHWSILSVQCTSKRTLEISNLLLERGAPENPGFLWQFRSLNF